MTEAEWDKKVWFEQLRHLRLQVIDFNPGIEWLECPVLVDLDLVYLLVQPEKRSQQII